MSEEATELRPVRILVKMNSSHPIVCRKAQVTLSPFGASSFYNYWRVITCQKVGEFMMVFEDGDMSSTSAQLLFHTDMRAEP